MFPSRRRTLVLLLAAGLPLAGAHAQETPPPRPAPGATDTAVPGPAPRSTFLPSVSLSVVTNGNVNVVGDGQSAVGASMSLVLPVTWVRPLSSLSARYSTGAQVYGGEHQRADELSHHVSASYQRTISRRSGFGLTRGGSRSEQQSLESVDPGEVVTLVPRTSVLRLHAGANANLATGTRSFLSLGLNGGATRYGDIPEGALDPEPDPNVPPPTNPSARVAFVDSTSGGANVGWGLNVSERTTIGVGYSYSQILFDDVDLSGSLLVPPRDTTVHAIHATGSRKLGIYTTGSVNLGVMRAQQDASEIAPGIVEPEVDRVEPSVGASISRQVSEQSALSFGLSQHVGAGNGRTGASIDRGAYGSWSWGRPKMGAGVTLAYWDREALDPFFGTAERTRAFQIGESFYWTPGVLFSYGVNHSFRDQQADDPTLESKGYHSGGFHVRWNIRGRSARVG